MNRKVRNESGEFVIESTFLMFITIMMVFFVINVGGIYYNRVVVTAVANESANAVAAIYGNNYKEPFMNFTDSDSVSSRNPYRYAFLGTKHIRENTEEKGKWYACYLLSKTELNRDNKKTTKKDFDGVKVECVDCHALDAVKVQVSITREYPVLTVNPTKALNVPGMSSYYTVKAEGGAVCYDLLHQMNSIGLKKQLFAKADDKSTIISIIDNAANALNNGCKAINFIIEKFK